MEKENFFYLGLNKIQEIRNLEIVENNNNHIYGKYSFRDERFITLTGKQDKLINMFFTESLGEGNNKAYSLFTNQVGIKYNLSSPLSKENKGKLYKFFQEELDNIAGINVKYKLKNEDGYKIIYFLITSYTPFINTVKDSENLIKPLLLLSSSVYIKIALFLDKME